MLCVCLLAWLAWASSPAVEMTTTTVTSNWASSILLDPSLLPQRSGCMLHGRIVSRNSRILQCHESPCTVRVEAKAGPNLLLLRFTTLYTFTQRYMCISNQRSARTDLVTSNVRAGQLSQPLQVFTDTFWLFRKRLGLRRAKIHAFYQTSREADQKILLLAPEESINVLDKLTKASRPIDSRSDMHHS